MVWDEVQIGESLRMTQTDLNTYPDLRATDLRRPDTMGKYLVLRSTSIYCIPVASYRVLEAGNWSVKCPVLMEFPVVSGK